MLRIRLSRVGKKKQPHYRVVIADVEAKRDGRIVERIGHYTPLTDPITYQIDEERALYWLSVGAQPSDAVSRLLGKQGTLERLQRLKGGESLDALVAEYRNEPIPAETQGELADVAVEATEAATAAVAEALNGEEE